MIKKEILTFTYFFVYLICKKGKKKDILEQCHFYECNMFRALRNKKTDSRQWNKKKGAYAKIKHNGNITGFSYKVSQHRRP